MFCLLLCVLWPGLCILRLRIVSRLRVVCLVVCRVLPGCIVSCSVFPQALPLLAPRDRVSGSCGLVMRSGRVSPGVRRVHGLVVIILPYNTKHYYYGRTRYWRTDWHGLRRWPLVRVGWVTPGLAGSGLRLWPICYTSLIRLLYDNIYEL